MKIEFPTNLIEYVLSGILIEASFFIMIPGLKIESNLFWSLVLISGAYVCGIGANSIATLYFTEVIERLVKKRKFKWNSGYLELIKVDVKEKLNMEIDDDVKNLSKIHTLLHNHIINLNEHYRANHTYQMRLYRMSRTSVIIVGYWLLFLLLAGFNIIPNSLVSSFKTSNNTEFWTVIIFLVILIVALHLATLLRIWYISGEAFSQYASKMNLHESKLNEKLTTDK